jgi:aldose sugar dehydrogenase
MKKISLILFIAIILVGTFVIGKYTGYITPAQTERMTTLLPGNQAVSDVSPVAWKVEVVTTDLFVPWSLVFTSPTRMLLTERNGTVRVIENEKLLPKPIHTFSEVKSTQEEGLMGMTLDPDYAANKYVYLVYAYPSGTEYIDKVVRFTDAGDHFEEEKVILDDIPAAQYHAGSRIKFGPDGKLYITTGDATDKTIAQDKNSLGGKILRLNSDGSIPADNPFPGSAIWSFGHRNPQGLDWHPVTQMLVETEHGPSGFDGPLGGDEINIIEKGQNYGWPVVSHKNHKDGLIDPLLVFTPAVAPAAGMFYSGDVFPQWKNHYFFAMLKGEGIMQVIFDDTDPKKVAQFEKLPDIAVGRVREIVQGPDGNIYFTSSNEDGRGNAKDGDDKIYRIVSSSSE